MPAAADRPDLAAENAALRLRLQEAEDTLSAIRDGEVDALVVGDQVYTLESAGAAANQMRRDVLAQMEDAVFARDAAGHVIYLNPAAERRYGITRSDALGRPWSELVQERWLRVGDPAEAEAAAALHATGRCNTQTLHARPDGSTLHAESSISRLLGAAGEAAGQLLVVRDVSERERVNAVLRESRARLQFTLASAGIGDWDLDLGSFAVRHSLRHDQCFGYTEPIALWGTKPFLSHLHPDDVGAVKEGFRRSLETGVDWQFEVRVIWPDRGVHWIAVHGALYRDGGNADRMLGTIVDVTQRKSDEQALRDADRRKDEFLATLAHELRNPLAPIRNALEVLRRGAAPELQERSRGVMERQLKQMVHLVDDLLDVSRINQGKVELRLAAVDLRTVVQQAVETSLPLLESKRHRLDIRLPPDELPVQGDLTRLVQVIANLANNAAKYTPPGGSVSIAAWREADEAVVAVEDSGIGIAAAMLPRVFEMFTQVDRASDRAQGGLGIGLALVRMLVELHGGRVAAESGGENRGARFVLRLPLAVESARPAAPLPAAAPKAAEPLGLRVLVVDDNVDSASTLAALFELMGHEARTANDGHSALHIAGDFRPQLAVLDIGLPDISGHEIAARLRASEWGAKATLIALSGWGRPEDRQRSKEAGFDLHIVKPVEPDVMIQIIEDLRPPSRS